MAVIRTAVTAACVIIWFAVGAADPVLPDAAGVTCEEPRQGASGEVLARRGCCSWHSGVCGYNGGNVTCCDGTQSPICNCQKDDPEAVL
jgi:hypothetical protein